MLILLWVVAVLALALALAYLNAPGIGWSVAIAGAIAVLWGAHLVPDGVALALDGQEAVLLREADGHLGG